MKYNFEFPNLAILNRSFHGVIAKMILLPPFSEFANIIATLYRVFSDYFDQTRYRLHKAVVERSWDGLTTGIYYQLSAS